MAGNVISEKVAQRAAVEARRRALPSEQVAEWGGEIQASLAALLLSGGRLNVLALYAAQSFEVPLWTVFKAARTIGIHCVFPFVTRGERVLRFREVTERHQLVERGRLKLLEPNETSPEVALHAVDVFIVPGVAFTTDGRRLGRGGGYYDATLAAAPHARRVGVAFDVCVVDDLATSEFDERVDVLVTPTRRLVTSAR